MERLEETSRLFLRDAEKDLTNKRYATCIVHLHMATEHALKAHLLKFGEEIQFKTLLEVANRLSTLGIIDKNELKKLSKINTLRNRIYHEGYLPTGYETSAAFRNVKKLIEQTLHNMILNVLKEVLSEDFNNQQRPTRETYALQRRRKQKPRMGSHRPLRKNIKRVKGKTLAA